MDLKDILKTISNLSKTYKIRRPYIVGGIPRDIYLGISDIKTTDIDVTTNSNDSLRLGILLADKINEVFELSEDGHVTVFSKQYDIDFSSNFVSKKVVNFLNGKHKGFEEVFSRDFTINTLHQDLETGKISDPTGQGFNDIKNKIIKTPVPPSITFSDDPRRVYRAVNLAVRYGFKLDAELVSFVRQNKQLFTSKNIKDNYATLKINKSLDEEPDLTIEILKDLDLFKIVPLTGKFKDTLISKKYLADYLNNYLRDSFSDDIND